MSTTSTAPTRTHDGQVIPAAGVWEIDPGHTDLAFTGRHFMVTKVRGRFTDVSGRVVIAHDMADSSVEVDIDMASVESGSQVRDDHIRSADLFDVENHPAAHFRSTSVQWRGDRGTVHGDLTIHGVTRRVPLDVVVRGSRPGPVGRRPRRLLGAHASSTARTSGSPGTRPSRLADCWSPEEIQIDINLETVLSAD